MDNTISHENIPVNNFEEYLSTINKFSDKYRFSQQGLLLFRGQSNSTWDLVPKIARNSYFQKIRSNFLLNEKEILQEFKQLGHAFADMTKYSNKWDFLALAQHYGLPTRLLDWTANPLAALYFAFYKEKETKKRAVYVFRLENSELIDINNQNPDELKKTIAYRPNHITPRITSQEGWFTFHYYRHEVKRISILNKILKYKGRIYKLVISNSERENILDNLNFFGINKVSLFPDLDGLSNYLEWKYFLR